MEIVEWWDTAPAGNWLCFAQLTPGSRPVPPGLGLFCTIGSSLTPHSPDVPPCPGLGLFRTTGPGEAGRSRDKPPRPPSHVPSGGKLALFRRGLGEPESIITPFSKGIYPPNRPGTNWLCFARKPRVAASRLRALAMVFPAHQGKLAYFVQGAKGKTSVALPSRRSLRLGERIGSGCGRRSRCVVRALRRRRLRGALRPSIRQT